LRYSDTDTRNTSRIGFGESLAGSGDGATARYVFECRNSLGYGIPGILPDPARETGAARESVGDTIFR
jgi:hypothetical protein